MPMFVDTSPPGQCIFCRLVAGETMGMKAGVSTFSPLHYLHLELEPGARFQTPTDHSESAISVVQGLVELDDGRPLGHGQMAVLEKGVASVICALEPSTVMVLGGEPVGERFIEWNFVSSRKPRIEIAKTDWREQRFPGVPGETEWIPLPQNTAKPVRFP